MLPHKNEKDNFTGARCRGNRNLNFCSFLLAYKQENLYFYVHNNLKAMTVKELIDKLQNEIVDKTKEIEICVCYRGKAVYSSCDIIVENNSGNTVELCDNEYMTS